MKDKLLKLKEQYKEIQNEIKVIRNQVSEQVSKESDIKILELERKLEILKNKKEEQINQVTNSLTLKQNIELEKLSNLIKVSEYEIKKLDYDNLDKLLPYLIKVLNKTVKGNFVSKQGLVDYPTSQTSTNFKKNIENGGHAPIYQSPHRTYIPVTILIKEKDYIEQVMETNLLKKGYQFKVDTTQLDLITKNDSVVIYKFLDNFDFEVKDNYEDINTINILENIFTTDYEKEQLYDYLTLLGTFKKENNVQFLSEEQLKNLTNNYLNSIKKNILGKTKKLK